MKIPKSLLILIFLVSCMPNTTSSVKESVVVFSSPTFTQEKRKPTSTPILDYLEKGPKHRIEPTFPNLPTKTSFPTMTLPATTPYPTFEVRNQKQHAPFEPAQCPPENPNYKQTVQISIDTFIPADLDKIVQQELDAGASFSQVKHSIEKALQSRGILQLIDLTGDGIPELIGRKPHGTFVFGCDEGITKIILNYSTLTDGGLFGARIFDVQDMNLNGIPDVLIEYSATSGGNTVVDILEWDGFQFNSYIQANHGENSSTTSPLARSLYWYYSPYDSWANSYSGTPCMDGAARIIIRDTDGNGTKELILTDNGPTHWDTLLRFGPWRGKEVVFKWDGIHYLYSSLEIDQPQFRFQAVQDADRLFLIGEYDRALELYQDVIFNDKLDWWSPEKMEYLRVSFIFDFNEAATPVPPQTNNEEYLLLSAYARYRILLHHLTRGWISDASTTYSTLVNKHPKGSWGYQFAEMATILWNEYQKTESIEESCLPVINYVESNSKILLPLGDREHGSQSHIYDAEDICPLFLVRK